MHPEAANIADFISFLVTTEISVAVGSDLAFAQLHKFCGYATYFIVNITTTEAELSTDDNVLSRPFRFNCEGITGAYMIYFHVTLWNWDNSNQ